MNIKYYPLYFALMLLFSCMQTPANEKWRKVLVQPKDKSQVITIITEKNKRYFMDGEHQRVPDDGYLLLDISIVDPLGDAIAVCWADSRYKWKIASAYAQLVENKLDTSQFLYFQPLGKYGEPISDGYTGSNCGSVLIREDLGPRGNLIVEYIQ